MEASALRKGNDSRLQRSEIVILAAILVAAAALRLGWPGVTEFKLDEARLASPALDLAELKAFPLHGHPTSVGLPKPAMSLYLYALPLALWHNPMSATLFTGLLNVLAVGLCWWMVRRYWGTPAAHLSALLYALAPWAVLSSRKIWEPYIMDPFVLAAIFTGLLAFVEGRRWALAPHILLVAIAVQIHYMPLILIPITLLLWIAYRHRVSWQPAAVGAGLSALTAVPFALYAWQHRSEIRQALTGLASTGPKGSGSAANFWWMLTTGSDIHSLAGAQAHQDFLQAAPNVAPAQWVTGILAVAGIAYLAWMAVRHRREPSAVAGGVVAIWAVLPVIFAMALSTPVYPHYLVTALPAPFIAAGVLLARIGSLKWKALRWGSAAVVLGIGAAQTSVVVVLFGFLASHATPGGFGMPIDYQLQAIERARAAGLPVTVVTEGDDPFVGDWPAAMDLLLRDTPHRLVDGRNVALFAAQPATVLLTPGAETAARIYAEVGLLDTFSMVATRAGEAPFYVLQLDGAVPSLALQPVPEPRLVQNGAEIVGYAAQTTPVPGATFEWRVAWRVASPPPDSSADYHMFNHLLDTSGERRAGLDGTTVLARFWQVGDYVVQTFVIAVPDDAGSGPFWMRVGMYTYPQIQNQMVVDAAGLPVSDAVILGPLTGLP